MTSKVLQGILFFAICLSAIGQTNIKTNFINPTGSYSLDNKTKIKHGDTYGYFGEVDVKLLDSFKIAMSFFVCKGAPSYNLGTFIDTLNYKKNIVIHMTPEDDTSCKIKFAFTKNGINVEQYQADLNFGCAFGHGVFADGFYKKQSSKVPEIKRLGRTIQRYQWHTSKKLIRLKQQPTNVLLIGWLDVGNFSSKSLFSFSFS